MVFAVLMVAFAVVCFTQVGVREGAALVGTVLAVVGLGLPLVYFLMFFRSVSQQAKKMGLTTPKDVYRVVLDEEGRMLFHRGMPKDKAGEIIGYIEGERLDLSCCIYSYDQWIVKSRDDGRIRREEEMVDAEAEEGTLDSVAADEVSKILCICGSGEAENIERRLRGRFPDVSIVRSSDHLVEIIGKGVSKAASAALLCREYGLGMEDAIAFGDSYNDEELLRAAGKGFLMGNAPEDLKDRISLHADDNDHEGIYRALQSLGLA